MLGPIRPETKIGANADVLFVLVFHNLPGVSEGEEMSYGLPGREEGLRRDLVEAFRHYSTLFADSYEYADHFSSADYSIDEDSFEQPELERFRSVLDEEARLQPLGDLHPRDVYNGCCAVIEGRRLQSPELRTVLYGVELFNDLFECALPTDDSRNPRCYIEVQSALDAAGPFLQWLSTIADVQHSLDRLSPKAEKVRVAFQPLLAALSTLKASFQEHRRPLSDLVLGKFLLIIDHYLHVIGDDREPIYHGDRLTPSRLNMAALPTRERKEPALSESNVVRAFGEVIGKRMTRKVIAQLQRANSGGLSGDDSVLKNLWDEICAQVQFQESFFWDAYEETVHSLVRAEIEHLHRHERDALWLQTPEGFDWLFEDKEEREPHPVCSDDIVEFLVREHIYSAAENWSNKRLREYLKRDYEID